MTKAAKRDAAELTVDMTEEKKGTMTRVEGAISTARLAGGSCGGAAALSPA